jgi:hypothetical protein
MGNDDRICDGSLGHHRNDLTIAQVKAARSKSPNRICLLDCSDRGKYKGATMKKVAIYAGLFVVLASSPASLSTTAAQSPVQAEANAVNITGKVSCSRFGIGSISARKGMSIAQTIQYCVNFQHGFYTLVSGKQIFRLTGDTNRIAKMSGKTVVIAGRVSPDEPAATSYLLMGNLQATSIAPAKN